MELEVNKQLSPVPGRYDPSDLQSACRLGDVIEGASTVWTGSYRAQFPYPDLASASVPSTFFSTSLDPLTSHPNGYPKWPSQLTTPSQASFLTNFNASINSPPTSVSASDLFQPSSAASITTKPAPRAHPSVNTKPSKERDRLPASQSRNGIRKPRALRPAGPVTALRKQKESTDQQRARVRQHSKENPGKSYTELAGSISHASLQGHAELCARSTHL